jgi:FKBP-type peptidyl-prolyl cis-trans isomerase FklB
MNPNLRSYYLDLRSVRASIPALRPYPARKRIKSMLHRKWIFAVVLALLTVAAVAQNTAAPDLKTDKDKFSYALGMNFGTNLRKQGLDLDPAVFAKAFAEAFNTGKTAMTEQDMETILTAAAQQIRAKQAAEDAAKAEQAKQEGEKFLAENKTKEGVVTLPSGLQYKILQQGTGAKPTLEDSVTCNYKGTFINGTVFDASEQHGGPASFQVKGVIAGWTEALQLMPTGSKWQLFIPANLAYGADAPPEIGPNTTLIFEVELVSVQKPTAPAADGQPVSK